MSTQSKKCRVEFYSNNERFTSLLGITPDHFSTVHLTDNVIVAVGIGDTESIVKIKVGAIVEITQTERGIVATFGEFDVPITRLTLRDLEKFADRQDCFVRLEDGGFTKSIHFKTPQLTVWAIADSLVPLMGLENVARQLGFEL